MANIERSKKGLLLAKIEGTYGTDPTPVPGSNVIRVTGGVTLTPQVTVVDRQIYDGDLSGVAGPASMSYRKVSFAVELGGNRTDGTADDISKGTIGHLVEIDCLLQACDLAATYTAETSSGTRDGYVTYNPTNPATEGPSVTFYFYTGLKLHKVTGAKGTCKLTGKAGGVVSLQFDFMGLDGGESDVLLSSVTPTWLSTVPPIFTRTVASIPIVWGSPLSLTDGTNAVAPVFGDLTADLGAKVTMRPDAGSLNGIRGFVVTERAPKATLNPESVAEGTYPHFANLKAGVWTYFGVSWGELSGNRVQVIVAGQVTSANYGDANGIRNLSLAVDVRRKLTDAIGSEFALRFG